MQDTGQEALYRSMKRIRMVEEALMAEYHPADEMRCPVHFCVGQEAPPAGVCASLEPGDYLFTGHRSHGYYLAKGGSLKAMFAELYGKATGCNAGIAGHHELSDEAVNFYSGTILVGTLAIAAGTALACQMKSDDRVTIAVFGDGGADQGLVYETLNFAALKRLPMVFICENNRYSVTSHQKSRQIPNIVGRAGAFGLPARSMSGNDATLVASIMDTALIEARAGYGPSFLELNTYRWCGHVGPEDDDWMEYRPAEELAHWKERCPIRLLEKDINALDVASIEAEIAQEIAEAFTFAKASPFPEPEAMFEHLVARAKEQRGLLGPEFAFDPWQPPAVPKPY